MMHTNEECRICGSEDFIITESRHQCALCATFVEVKPKKPGSKKRKKRQHSPGSVSTNQGLPNQKVCSSPQEQVEHHEKWTTFEAFNVIIKKQVDALVNFGANKGLHEVVLQLWAYYLKLTDVAFPDVQKTSAASYAFIPRNRDYNIHNSESEAISHRRIAMFPRKKPFPEGNTKEVSKKTKRKRTKDDSICEGDVPLILAHIDDIKEELKNHSDSEMEHEELELEERLQHARQLFNKSEKTVHRSAVKQVEYMCMFKTVAFCYLGILLLEDCILLGDMRRWIREGHFPYLEATNLLPPSMKLQGLDFLAFKQPGPPSSKDVRYATGRLAHFLGIKELQRPPLTYVVARFLVDLNLPAELNTIVCSFMETEPAEMEWGKNHYKNLNGKPGPGVNLSVPNYEARAVAYIAVVLKLLFGLDDHVEKEISRYAKKLSKLNRIGKEVFIWDEWVQHINLKLNFLKAYHSPCTISEWNCDVADTNNLHQFFRSSMSKWHQSSEVVKQRTYHKHKQSCSSIQQLLGDLNNLKEDSSSLLWPPASFPFTQAASQFCSKLFNNESCILVEDFRGRTLSYLTHPYLWQQYAENRVSVPKWAHVVNSEFKNFSVLNYGYWFHDVKINNLNTFFIAELPESFQWLLVVLCYCTEVKLTEIYAEVLLIEKVVLGCGKTSRAQRMKLKANYW